MTHGSPIPTSSHHIRSDAWGLWELTWAKRPEQCLAQDQTHPWVNPCTHRPSDTLGAPHSQSLKPPPTAWVVHPQLLALPGEAVCDPSLTMPSLPPFTFLGPLPHPNPNPSLPLTPRPGRTIRLSLKTPQACVLSDLPSPLVSLTTGGGGGGGGGGRWASCCPLLPWLPSGFSPSLCSTLISPPQRPSAHLPVIHLLVAHCLGSVFPAPPPPPPQNGGSLWRGSFACLVHCCVQGPGAQSMLSVCLLNLHLQTVHAQLSSEQTLSNLQSRL